MAPPNTDPPSEKRPLFCIQCPNTYKNKRDAEDHRCNHMPEDRLLCLQGGCTFYCWHERGIRRHWETWHGIFEASMEGGHWEDLETEDVKETRKLRIRDFRLNNPTVIPKPEDVDTLDEGATHPASSMPSESSSAMSGQPGAGLLNDAAADVQGGASNAENTSAAVEFPARDDELFVWQVMSKLTPTEYDELFDGDLPLKILYSAINAVRSADDGVHYGN